MNTCFVFDLDGTLTKMELLPVVARAINLEREIEILTNLTISGKIPFRESFRLRFAILKSTPVEIVQKAVDQVELDQTILDFIRNRSDNCFVITGNLDVWLEPIIKKLDCRVFTSRALREGPWLKDLSYITHKADAVLELRTEFEHIVAIGEGANDIPMFEASDIGIAYGGVHPATDSLIGISDYVVNESGALCRLLATL